MAHRLSYREATTRHDCVRRAPAAEAEPVWSALAGVPGPGGPAAAAVADTLPDEHAVRLVLDDCACAAATSCLAQTLAAGGDPHRAALAGWSAFAEMAAAAEELRGSTGACATAAWPMYLDGLGTGSMRRLTSEELVRIARMAGRMYRAVQGLRERNARGVRQQPVGIELGGDVQSLLPSELALCGHPATLGLLALRVTEKRAVQRDKRGEAEKASGPLVLLMDESESMEARELLVWSKAVLLTLTRVAWEKQRHVRVVHYSTSTRVRDLPPGAHQELGRALGHFMWGGTAIDRALDVGLREVRALAQKGQRGADIVLTSDGVCSNRSRHPACVGAINQAGVRLWSVALGVDFTGPIRDGAARYVKIEDHELQGDGAVARFAEAAL